MSDVLTIGSDKAKIDDRANQKKIEEAKKKAKEIAEEMVKKQFRTPFIQVYNEVTFNNKTVEDVIEEVNQKKSPMTKVARDYVLNFETERIKQWIEDENNKRNKQKR